MNVIHYKAGRHRLIYSIQAAFLALFTLHLYDHILTLPKEVSVLDYHESHAEETCRLNTYGDANSLSVRFNLLTRCVILTLDL